VNPDDVPGIEGLRSKLREIDTRLSVLDADYLFDRQEFALRLAGYGREGVVTIPRELLEDVRDNPTGLASAYSQDLSERLISAILPSIESRGLIPFSELTLRSLLLKYIYQESKQQQAVNKYNTIGRGALGDVERWIGTTLTREEKDTLIWVWGELVRLRLIAPTGTDMMNPDDWVRTTDRGNAAIERKPSEDRLKKDVETMENYGGWQVIKPLGEGGQSNVYLVRTPARVAERSKCLEDIRISLDGDRRDLLATSIVSFARQDHISELGALKIFKIPAGDTLSPLPDSEQYEAIERLKNEVAVLRQDMSGLPKLLDANVDENWIVTEYFPEGSLSRNRSKYKGNVALGLRAFRSLVRTVARLHQDGYVHRDIKPANIFIRRDDQLVLGDFGIVYLPNDQERLTQTGEKVGPRDNMPQWANLGGRQDKVDTCFDVYMLGKLLWLMLDGRPILPREYHNRPDFDLTKSFPNDPEMYFVNRILDRCVVEEADKCLSSAGDLLLMVDEMLTIIGHGGQMLGPHIPRPCRVCGKGVYKPEHWRAGSRLAEVGQIRIWQPSDASGLDRLLVRTFVCDNCGHIEFFKT
jgi:serine/threonine protein kinase